MMTHQNKRMNADEENIIDGIANLPNKATNTNTITISWPYSHLTDILTPSAAGFLVNITVK